MTWTFRVLDLTTTLAGAYCGHLLAATGDRRHAGRAARRAPAAARGAPAARRSPTDGPARCSSGWPAASRASPSIPRARRDVAELLAWAATVDAVLWSPGRRRRRRAVCGRRSPDVTVTAITPFGLTGPWADRAGHRVHAAGAVRRARPARLAGVAADVGRRPARRVHGRRVRRRGDADRAAPAGRHRRGRGHRRVRASSR